MNQNSLILKQNMKRFIFTIIGITIAGIVLVFGLFMAESIKASITQNVLLEENEYFLYVDDNKYRDVPINYYESLKNDFETVIPFVNMSSIVNDKYSYIIGTDLSKNKIVIDNIFYDIGITMVDNNSGLPGIIFAEGNTDIVIGSQLDVEGITYQVVGYFILEDFSSFSLSENNIFLMDYTDYKLIDNSIFGSESGIEKFIFTKYYIISDFGESLTLDLISGLYNEPLIFAYMDSHDSLFRSQSSQYTIFQGVAVSFFALISVFIFINIAVSVNLTLRERKGFYSILVVLGMKSSTLRLMILKEMSIISFASAVISIILGILISFVVQLTQPGLVFAWIGIFPFLLVFLAILLVPIIHTLIVSYFIKYKNLTKSDFI